MTAVSVRAGKVVRSASCVVRREDDKGKMRWPQAPARLECNRQEVWGELAGALLEGERDRSGETPPLRPAGSKEAASPRTDTTAEAAASPHKRARTLKRPEELAMLVRMSPALRAVDIFGRLPEAGSLRSLRLWLRLDRPTGERQRSTDREARCGGTKAETAPARRLRYGLPAARKRLRRGLIPLPKRRPPPTSEQGR
jgi:hypothetical protein